VSKTLLSNKEVTMSEKITRREVIKRTAYLAPAILTLSAVPAFAKGGSGGRSNKSSSWSGGGSNNKNKYKDKKNKYENKNKDKKKG
jgi:hypothetical protein